jgi:hypothetical protein
MKPDRIAKALFVMGLGIVLVFMSSGCNMPSLDLTEDLATLEPTSTATPEVAQATELPTEKPTDTPEPSPDTPTPAMPQGPTMTPLAAPIAPQGQLSEEGPWLVYRAGEGHSVYSTLYIVNADGSGRRPLSSGIGQEFEVEVMPSGDRFAYVLPGSENADGIPHLIVRRIPGGEIETDITLVSEDVWETISNQEDLANQVLRALSGPEAFEWSPHVGGHYLAFAAALDKPKLDLYRFDTWSNNIRPLTTGPYHRFKPFWSPDGQWILHHALDDFGDGELWNAESLSAVSFDGSDSKKIYAIGGHQHELVKWMDDTTFLMTEVSSVGTTGLMRAKISGGSPEVLYPGTTANLDETSLDDLQTVVARCVDEGQNGPGVYFYYFDDETHPNVLPGACRSVRWWQGKGVFVVNGEDGTAFIRRTGEVVKQMDDMVDSVSLSPDGLWMVTYGEDGATVFTHIGTLIHDATDGAVKEVIWRPDGAGFFLDVYWKSNLHGSHQLYTYDLDEWELQLVDLDYRAGDFWGGLPASNP